MSVDASTLLEIPQGNQGSVLQEVIAIGTRNAIPLGLVIPNKDLCRAKIELPASTVSVRDLLANIESTVPAYRAEVIGGVVNIEPKTLPKDEFALLNVKIDQFASHADTHQGTGAHLWMFIRAVIAPGESTGIAGGHYTSEEKISGMRVEDRTVRQILNLIVQKGHGGAWTIENLEPNWGTSSPTLPYRIFGYRDGGGALQRFTCPAEAKPSDPGQH